jgi:hypothetical protein
MPVFSEGDCEEPRTSFPSLRYKAKIRPPPPSYEARQLFVILMFIPCLLVIIIIIIIITPTNAHIISIKLYYNWL